MSKIVPLITFLLSEILSGYEANYCGQSIFYETNGTIKTQATSADKTISCFWTLHHPYNTITTIRILQTDLTKCLPRQPCCLSIINADYNKKHIKLCNEIPKNPVRLSVRENKTLVFLEASENTETLIHYSTRSGSECSHSEFQCFDKTGCYNSTDSCNRDFVCKDHSDQVDCGKCPINLTLCNRKSRKCFDPVLERCDGVLHCPKGEDELGCSDACPNLIKCPEGNKCIKQDQICNLKSDCSNDYDEMGCSKEESTNTYFSVVFIVSSLCSTCFMCIIFHWISSRRHTRRFLNNPPDFPLAPFEGPGDQEHESSSSEIFTDSEFRQGGGIYESYIQNIKKSKTPKLVQSNTTREKSYMDLDGDNELVVLASLNIPVDMCVGLTLSSEKSPLSEALQQRLQSTSKITIPITNLISGESFQSTEIQCIDENPKKYDRRSGQNSEETYVVSNGSEWTDIGETTGSSTGIIFVKSATKL